jgi:hypothetical protein
MSNEVPNDGSCNMWYYIKVLCRTAYFLFFMIIKTQRDALSEPTGTCRLFVRRSVFFLLHEKLNTIQLRMIVPPTDSSGENR